MGGRPKGLQAARRHKVGILWLKGFSVRDIAALIQKDSELVGAGATTHVTVHRDIQAIKEDLKRHQLEDLEIRRARSIDHLRMIQNRAWTEIAGVRESRDLPGGGTEYVLKVPTPTVRAQLLNVISATEDRIAKLEGTLAPVELTGKGGKDLVPREPMTFLLPDGGVFIPHSGNGEDGNGFKETVSDG